MASTPGPAASQQEESAQSAVSEAGPDTEAGKADHPGSENPMLILHSIVHNFPGQNDLYLENPMLMCI